MLDSAKGVQIEMPNTGLQEVEALAAVIAIPIPALTKTKPPPLCTYFPNLPSRYLMTVTNRACYAYLSCPAAPTLS